jgi:hypothetical protein
MQGSKVQKSHFLRLITSGRNDANDLNYSQLPIIIIIITTIIIALTYVKLAMY